MADADRRLVVSASSFYLLLIHRSGLFRALHEAGYSVLAVAPDGRGKDELERNGVDVEVLQMQPTGTSPLADLVLLRRFVALFRRVRPQAFLGFTVKPNVYGSAAARLCAVPSINNISGLGRTFISRNLLTRLVERLYHFGLRGSRVVFFENRDDAQLFLDRKMVRPELVVPLPGAGVDLAHFAPMKRTRGPDSAFTFLFAGRLLWDKGIRQYVDAAWTIRRDHPDVRFQILGFVEPPGRDSVPAETLDQWDRSGIVDYLGGTRDVRENIAVADCVVLPSYYREGVPRILMEASAMGVPTIATDAPGCREAVDDGVTGFLCEPRSVTSLVEAMERLMQLPARARAAMGSAARKKMEREFREEIVHRAYLDALARIGVAES